MKEELQKVAPSCVIVGGALGWDTLVARAAYLSSIPFSLYVPFEGQDSKWPEDARQRYRIMTAHAAEIKVISPGGYAAYKMQVRNVAMVDDCDEVWALWDGSKGGTANCIAYAESIGKPMKNFYSSGVLIPIHS